MEKEEILLGVEMERLKIASHNLNNLKSTNPFFFDVKNNFNLGNSSLKDVPCTCAIQRKHKHAKITKKKPTKIIKEPILKLLKSTENLAINVEIGKCHESNSKSNLENVKCDPLNLCSLVQNCNQLKISTSTSDTRLPTTSSASKWWKNNTNSTQECRDSTRQATNNVGTCSQQALNPPCDVTIDELASYFETLVHIPKKMSSMAEMMYI